MVLTSISARAHQIIREQQDCLMNDVLPLFTKNGFQYIQKNELTPQQINYLQKLFLSEIFPLLTPLRTDTQAFPNIKNLNVYAGFLLKPIAGIKSSSDFFTGNEDAPRIAFVEIPSKLAKIYWMPSDKKTKQFALINDIITLCGTQLFPGFEVEESLVFKVTRDADFAVDEDSGSNFIHAMEDVLIQRKSSWHWQGRTIRF